MLIKIDLNVLVRVALLMFAAWYEVDSNLTPPLPRCSPTWAKEQKNAAKGA
ncbi:MAG: hypothetical protein ACRC3G_06850 [Bacteroidales bacterium]